MGKTTMANPIHLAYSEKDRQVVVSPADEDRYVLTVQEAIDACRAYAPADRARVQKSFHSLLNDLGAWVNKRGSAIARAHVTIRDRGFLFLVVTRRSDYNDDFEDELTDLDVRIARDPKYDGVRLSVLAVPNCRASEYETFINSEFALSYGVANA